MKKVQLIIGFLALSLGYSAFAQIVVLPRSQSARVFAYFEAADFEDLPAFGDSCASTGATLDNPLTNNTVVITDPFCLRSGFCSSPTCIPDRNNSSGGNTVLFLSPGATIDFTNTPTVAILDIEGSGEDTFHLTVTDASGATLESIVQGHVYARSFAGYFSDVGITRIQLMETALGGPMTLAAVAEKVATHVASIVSSGARDGYIVESSETSNQGGTVVAASMNFAAIRAGDTEFNQQIKSILSFDTSSISQGTPIVFARLFLQRGTVVGVNPFEILGPCYVDVKGGNGFSTLPALQKTDFQTLATAVRAGQLSNPPYDGAWSSAVLNGPGTAAINKTGITQCRIYFAIDDNDNSARDFIGWYSGENPDPGKRPFLQVYY